MAVAVAVGAKVGVAVGVAVAEGAVVGVDVGMAVAVAVGVRVAVGVTVGVGVGAWYHTTSTGRSLVGTPSFEMIRYSERLALWPPMNTPGFWPPAPCQLWARVVTSTVTRARSGRVIVANGCCSRSVGPEANGCCQGTVSLARLYVAWLSDHCRSMR